MLTNVSVVKIPQSTYPNKQGLFRPHIKYPEYLWDEIAGHENYAYEGVRQALYLMKLDIIMERINGIHLGKLFHKGIQY